MAKSSLDHAVEKAAHKVYIRTREWCDVDSWTMKELHRIVGIAGQAPPRGCVVLAHKPPMQMRGLVLPHEVQGIMRPDTGIVLSAGREFEADNGVTVADIVLMYPYTGFWIEDTVDDEVFQFRYYASSMAEGIVAVAAQSLEDVLNKQSPQYNFGRCDYMEKLRAIQDKIIVRCAPARKQTAGGLWLPDGTEDPLDEGVIVSVGPKTDDAFEAGKTVLFSPSRAKIVNIDSDDTEYRVMDEGAVLCIKD